MSETALKQNIIVKKQRPTSPGRRHHVAVKNTGLFKGKAESSLLVKKTRKGGRNNLGRVTVRHQGGGHKKKYRLIDFKRNDKDGIFARVERIEHDPNRTAYIALLLYKDGERRYIIAPRGLEVGDMVVSGSQAPIKLGNCLPLANIPVGSVVHSIEMHPGKGAQLARSAGCYAQLLAREGRYITLRLRSGEMRKVLLNCRATIGEASKSEHNLQKIGKAGRNRWKGKKPRVRGVAMNPVDHPMGGGEGRKGKPSRSPWGLRKGKKTRSPKKSSSRLIVRRRKQNASRGD